MVHRHQGWDVRSMSGSAQVSGVKRWLWEGVSGSAQESGVKRWEWEVSVTWCMGIRCLWEVSVEWCTGIRGATPAGRSYKKSNQLNQEGISW